MFRVASLNTFKNINTSKKFLTYTRLSGVHSRGCHCPLVVYLLLTTSRERTLAFKTEMFDILTSSL